MTDSWETDELYNWISSDEYLYREVLGLTAGQLRQDEGVLYICRSEDIDPTLVDWDELAACITTSKGDDMKVYVLVAQPVCPEQGNGFPVSFYDDMGEAVEASKELYAEYVDFKFPHKMEIFTVRKGMSAYEIMHRDD